MTVLELLANDNFISVNRSVMKRLGLECAVLLGELCSEYTYWKKEGRLKDGMFYCTVDKLKENTTLSKYQQLQALERLQKLDIVTVELHGVPATRYFKINEIQLSNFLTSDSCLKIEQQDVQKLDSSNTNNTINRSNKSTNVDLEQATPTRRHLITPVNSSNVDSKHKKKNLYEKCADYVDEYTDNDRLKNMLIDYLKFRLAVKDKPIYFSQWRSLVNTLNDLASDSETKYKIVQQI